jgi:hypothetical protein
MFRAVEYPPPSRGGGLGSSGPRTEGVPRVCAPRSALRPPTRESNSGLPPDGGARTRGARTRETPREPRPKPPPSRGSCADATRGRPGNRPGSSRGRGRAGWPGTAIRSPTEACGRATSARPAPCADPRAAAGGILATEVTRVRGPTRRSDDPGGAPPGPRSDRSTGPHRFRRSGPRGERQGRRRRGAPSTVGRDQISRPERRFREEVLGMRYSVLGIRYEVRENRQDIADGL